MTTKCKKKSFLNFFKNIFHKPNIKLEMEKINLMNLQFFFKFNELDKKKSRLYILLNRIRSYNPSCLAQVVELNMMGPSCLTQVVKPPYSTE